MPVVAISRFERFFCLAAGLAVNRNDLKRNDDFVNDKIYHLLLAATAMASANGRDVIQQGIFHRQEAAGYRPA